MKQFSDKHLHMSGGTDPVVLWELISEGGLKTQAKTFWEFKRTMTADKRTVTNQQEYLNIIHTIDHAQSSPSAIERCSYNCFASSYLSGCSELELRWNPVKRSQDGRIDLDRLVIAGRSGMERAMTTYGIRGSMLLCLGRDCSPAENEATFTMALRYQGKGVAGLDTAGPEDKPIQEKHPYLRHYYKAAAARKMITKCHCGEKLMPWTEDEMQYVIEDLHPQCLGHGIQIHRYPKLMALAAAQGTELEICISSNLATGVVKNLAEFKRILRKIEEHQIPFHFHTDATFLLNTNIQREHELAEQIKRQ